MWCTYVTLSGDCAFISLFLLLSLKYHSTHHILNSAHQ
uniref:Uncharacterized protein n=1 Tax=Anguilla anguilla TaxID=7936 RepID=A0A0E9T191_ANGAN